MVRFIDDHRVEYGVEPICEVLPIAPSTYYRHKVLEANPSLRSARAQRDEVLKVEIRRVWDANLAVYGAEKVYKQLNREGIRVARCTVERLMGELGLEGAVRGRAYKARPSRMKGAKRPLDLVERDFRRSDRISSGSRT
jgi:putative transposase